MRELESPCFTLARNSDAVITSGTRLGERFPAFQMTRATPKMRDFAEHLITHEARRNKPSTTKPPSTFVVIEKLRPHLANLMGNAGFRALLSRSLALANAEVPWLRAVQLNADNSLEGLDNLEAQVGADNFFEGRVVLLAQLLGLLTAFIGENLTLRMVVEAWPNLPINDLDFSKRDKYEKTN